jgi:hypothetical protein
MAWTNPRDWTDGEFVTESILDTHIRDNLLAVGPHLIVRKTSDQSVTSSTVLVDDSALVLAVAANEIWRFELMLFYESGSTEDFKFSWSFPTSGVLSSYVAHLDAANAFTLEYPRLTASDGVTVILSGGAGAGAPRVQPVYGLFVNSTNAGNVTFRFAQNTSGATSAIVKANSTLWAVKLA